MTILFDHINVKEAPYFARGDGVTDDTAAIQAVINYVSGRNNQNTLDIYFPTGSYVITSGLTYTGNETSSFRFRGDKSSFQAGSIILWKGTSSLGTMFTCFGANQCEFDNMIFDANPGNSWPHPAAVGVWLQSDQAGGGAGSSNIFFRYCQFLSFEGDGYYQDSAGVNIGLGSGPNYEIQAIYFDGCTFTGYTGSYPTHVPFAGVQDLQQSVGNSEIIHFRACQIQYAQFGYHCLGGNNGLSFTDGTQFGGCVQASVWVDGTAQVLFREVSCESQNSVARNGIFFRGGANTQCHIDSCEIVLDGYNQASLVMPAAYVTGGTAQWNNLKEGTIITVGGPTVIENSILDATDGLGVGPILNIQANNTAIVSGTAPGSLIITGCNIVNGASSGQINVIDIGGNYLTTAFVPGTVPGTQNRHAIYLYGNIAGPSNLLMPDFEGQPRTVYNLGTYSSGLPNSPYFEAPVIYQSEPRVTTTCYQITFTDPAFIQNATVVNTLMCGIAAKTIILRVFVDLLTPFQGAGATSTFDLGKDVASVITQQQYINTFDIHTAPITKGLADIDLGPGLARALLVQGGDPSEWGGAYSLYTTFTFASAAGNGSSTHLTQGQMRIYVTTEQVKYA